MQNATNFLQAELAHAQRQLDRLRRIEAPMQAGLAAQSLSETTIYERLATSKAYKQLRRDEVAFQQVWLRAHHRLLAVTKRAIPTVTAGNVERPAPTSPAPAAPASTTTKPPSRESLAPDSSPAPQGGDRTRRKERAVAFSSP